MKTFRCPKCKLEETETIYLKIKSVVCSNCKLEMVKLHNPTNNQLKKEMEICLSLQK